MASDLPFVQLIVLIYTINYANGSKIDFNQETGGE
jgi:hypothetical protein